MGGVSEVLLYNSFILLLFYFPLLFIYSDNYKFILYLKRYLHASVYLSIWLAGWLAAACLVSWPKSFTNTTYEIQSLK